MALKLGTRESRLAVIQAEEAAKALSSAGVETELVLHTTHGDRETSSPIYSMSRTGIFVEELNGLILSGEIDAAVHSAKDIPSMIDSKLEVSAVLPRAPWNDVIVSPVPLEELPVGAVIGTSSRRRISQIRSFRRDFRIKDIRGNIDTRLRKLREGGYDAIVLARAALDRMGKDVEFHDLEGDGFIPAPNQGIIAIVSEKGGEISRMLKGVSHGETMDAFSHERSLVVSLNLGCSMPAGIICTPAGKDYEIRARFYSLDSLDFRDYRSGITGKHDVEALAERIKSTLPAEFGYGFGV